jgi:putative membrane protein
MEGERVNLLIAWLLNAIGLLIVAYLIPGIRVDSFRTAVIAAAAIAIVNATLGLVLKIVTFPLALLTLGIFYLIVNAILLMIAAGLVKGFEVKNFFSAFLGAIVLSIVNSMLRWIVMS